MNTETPIFLRSQSRARRESWLLPAAIWLALFVCGGAAWIFKMRSRSGPELLPLSPLQVLIPLTGAGALFAILMAHGARFPKILARSRASILFGVGIAFISLGAALHFRLGPSGVEAVLFIARWFMPFFFATFYWFAERHGVTWRPLAWGLVVGALVSGLAVELYRRGVNLPIDQKTEGRFGGFFSHPNQYGIVTSVSACFIAVFLHSQARWLKLLGLAMMPIWGLCLFQSLSKTNMILFVVTLMACGFVFSLQSVRKLLKALFLSGALLVVLGVMGALTLQFMGTFMPREAKLLEDAIFDPRGVRSLDVREDVWADAWTHIVAHPWLGLGPGRANEALIKNHAHNLFMQMQIDAGLLGFIGICFVVIATLWRAAELARAAMRHRGEMTDDDAVRYSAGVGLVIYVIGNSMSDSFGTATIPIFCMFFALAFVNLDWKTDAAD